MKKTLIIALFLLAPIFAARAQELGGNYNENIDGPLGDVRMIR